MTVEKKTPSLEVLDAEAALVRVMIDSTARECRLVTGAFRAFAKEKGVSYQQLSKLFAEDSIEVLPGVIYHALKIRHGDAVSREAVEAWADNMTMQEAVAALSAFTIAFLGNAVALPVEITETTAP